MSSHPVGQPGGEGVCPFGAKLREVRELKGLNKSALARASGLARGAISRLERGLHPPDYPTLAKLAAALGVRPDAFKCPGWSPPPPGPPPRRWK